ncbi:MAG: hypothetical protein ACFFB3_06555 [Candidatus Hodarchaeota archaeon]
MTAKERHRIKIIEYYANPENKPIDRVTLAKNVLGFAHSVSLYRIFTPDELSEIENEAKEIRRRRYAVKLMQVDSAMMNQAMDGNDRAAKLCYQRFEDWSERKRSEITGKDGEDLGLIVNVVNYAQKND